MEIKSESHDKDEWYSKTKQHWEKTDSTITGILGGNENVHDSDVKTSCELLEGLIRLKKITPLRVIDCGAGIGRVTKNVLLSYFEEIELIEQDEKFIQTCRSVFENEQKIKEIYHSSLQDFSYTKKYNVIWVQWCLENLEDDDLEIFLQKCHKALDKNGAMIVKENILIEGDSQYTSIDYSKLRSLKAFKAIFKRAGFRICKSFIHPNWPEDLMKVSVFVLKLKSHVVI